MKISKKLLFLVVAVCAMGIVSAFKNFEYKEDVPKGVKYEYAVVYIQYGAFATSSMNIVYSDGKVEDYKKMNRITTYDLTDHETKIVIDCFNYLNQQNYELRSSTVGGATETHYFARKVSQ